MLQISSDRFLDIQIPDRGNRTACIPVDPAQQGTADIMIELLCDLLSYFFYNPAGRIQHLPFHQGL